MLTSGYYWDKMKSISTRGQYDQQLLIKQISSVLFHLLILRASVSSRTTDAGFSAHAKARSNTRAEHWNQAMVLHHAAFSFAVALFSVAGNLISSH